MGWTSPAAKQASLFAEIFYVATHENISMLIYMRTTLLIDNAVFAASKRRAVDEGVTLSHLVTQALREALRQRAKEAAVSCFSMPVYGGANAKETSPAELASLRDEGR